LGVADVHRDRQGGKRDAGEHLAWEVAAVDTTDPLEDGDMRSHLSYRNAVGFAPLPLP
jgi:hypothetical protein